MRNYELTYIIKPDLDPASVTALIERVNGLVTAEGGAVVKTNQWGMRHLAYPIRRYREGNYVFTVVQLESTSLARVEQRLRLIEDLLRYLLVRADDEGEGEGTAETTDVMGGSDVAAQTVDAAEADALAEPATADAVNTPAEAPVA
jgi:small subunit ribosomal protein S6